MMDGEFWYGSCVKYGRKMPFSESTREIVDFTQNQTPNQAMPLLVSSKGRAVWRNTGFQAEFDAGILRVPDDCIICREGKTLRDAYLGAARRWFPFSGKAPAEELFSGILYNTWIELTFYQTQKAVLEYAEKILEAGMPAGVIMIDDGWSECYGDWRFHSGKFPDPENMLRKLKDMGFHVMVWICPYLSADSVKYREAEELGILVKNPDGETYIARWWNGYSAVLDFSNPEGAVWMKKQLDALCEMGVDGFKFDAGDSIYYRNDNVTFGGVTPDEQSGLWAEFGAQYSFNEYRVTFRAGGMPLLQRLCDKDHSWGDSGIASLIPDLLLQGITGHPYGCPDMIGGGEYRNFQEIENSGLDQELFVRHSEIACLMPAMQFSAAPWRVLDEEHFRAVLRSVKVRKQYLPYLMEKVRQACRTGEPVIRYMAYEFPEEPVETLTDQFMLGEKYLVAPVWKKGQKGRQVYLPGGVWKRGDTRIESKGETVYCDSCPGEPIVLERELKQ